VRRPRRNGPHVPRLRKERTRVLSKYRKRVVGHHPTEPPGEVARTIDRGLRRTSDSSNVPRGDEKQARLRPPRQQKRNAGPRPPKIADRKQPEKKKKFRSWGVRPPVNCGELKKGTD